MDGDQRRLMNRAFFDKLYVIDGEVVDLTFNAPFDDLDNAKTAIQWTYRRRKVAARDVIEVLDPVKAVEQIVTLGDALLAVGSNNGVMGLL